MSSRKCSPQGPAAARTRSAVLSDYNICLVSYSAAEHSDQHEMCAQTYLCPWSVLLPGQKVWWTQPRLFSTCPHCSSLTSVVQVSPYSLTTKVFLAMSCCTEMVYFPRAASEAKGKDRSTMPCLDFTFCHSAIRLCLGSYLGRNIQRHKVTLGA